MAMIATLSFDREMIENCWQPIYLAPGAGQTASGASATEPDLQGWLTVLASALDRRSGWLREVPRPSIDESGWRDFPFESLFGAPVASHRQQVKSQDQPVWLEDPISSVRDILETLPREESIDSPRRPLDFLGRQFFRHLPQQDGATASLTVELRKIQDLRMISVRTDAKLESGEHKNVEGTKNLFQYPPPFAYVGEWNHDPETAFEVELTAASALWRDDLLRREAVEWMRSRGETRGLFLFDHPPLAYYCLRVEGTVNVVEKEGPFPGRKEGERVERLKTWTFDDLTIEIELPHRMERGVLTGLPSLISLHCPVGRKGRCHRCGQESTPHDEATADNIEDGACSGCGVSPGPSGDRDPDCVGRPSTLLVASPHLRTAVAQMAELWEDQGLRRILFIAPPGSGKEVLVRFLHAGSCFFRWRGEQWACGRKLAHASLVGVEPASVLRTLFGRAESAGQNGPNPVPGERLRGGKVWQDGLVLAAEGSTVFLDEIDKCDEEVRSALLRFVENDEVQPEGCGSPFPLEEEYKRFRPRIVFAASMPRATVLTSSPPDFWTRIGRIIEVLHPLEIHSLAERQRCIEEYFILFLYRVLEDRYNKDSSGADEQAFGRIAKAIIEGGTVRESDIEAMVSRKSDYPFLYLQIDVICSLSSSVADFLAQFPASDLSVRNLKAIAKQLDYQIRLWMERRLDVRESRGQVAAPSYRAQKMREEVGEEQDPLKRITAPQWIWPNLHEISINLFR